MPPSSGGGWRVRSRLQRTSICTLLLKGPPPEHMRKSLRFTSTITHERGTYERTRKSKLDIAWSKVALLEGQVTAIQIALRTLLRHSQNRAAATGLINEELEKVIASALSRNLDPAYLDGLYRAQKGLAGYDDGNL